ncbi:Hypothetical_protein [Hexamita inflata]|uniref:Hypothetical_protein n=1 Tax=Hexamita inflata TaxID=28002 RepID=A0ABP1HSW5_9EUKA
MGASGVPALGVAHARPGYLRIYLAARALIDVLLKHEYRQYRDHQFEVKARHKQSQISVQESGLEKSFECIRIESGVSEIENKWWIIQFPAPFTPNRGFWNKYFECQIRPESNPTRMKIKNCWNPASSAARSQNTDFQQISEGHNRIESQIF